MRGPSHPLVVEDGVGPHLVRDDYGLERVSLQSISLINSGVFKKKYYYKEL